MVARLVFSTGCCGRPGAWRRAWMAASHCSDQELALTMTTSKNRQGPSPILTCYVTSRRLHQLLGNMGLFYSSAERWALRVTVNAAPAASRPPFYLSSQSIGANREMPGNETEDCLDCRRKHPNFENFLGRASRSERRFRAVPEIILRGGWAAGAFLSGGVLTCPRGGG